MADNGVDDWCLFHISVVAFIKFVWTVRIFRVAPPVILDMFMFGFHICCRAFDSELLSQPWIEPRCEAGKLYQLSNRGGFN